MILLRNTGDGHEPFKRGRQAAWRERREAEIRKLRDEVAVLKRELRDKEATPVLRNEGSLRNDDELSPPQYPKEGEWTEPPIIPDGAGIRDLTSMRYGEWFETQIVEGRLSP